MVSGRLKPSLGPRHFVREDQPGFDHSLISKPKGASVAQKWGIHGDLGLAMCVGGWEARGIGLVDSRQNKIAGRIMPC